VSMPRCRRTNPIFSSGTPWRSISVAAVCRRTCALIGRAGIVPAAKRRPRLHDLRHTFAVRALQGSPRHDAFHPNAAAIDVGATMHMAAVSQDRTPEPVRSFGTFTTDLHRLVEWFVECGVETVVMESTGV